MRTVDTDYIETKHDVKRDKEDSVKSYQVEKAVFSFSQEGNTLGTTSEYEELEVSIESQLFMNKEDYFFVLRTNTGWSIDSTEEISEIINKCKKSVTELLEGN